MSSKFFSYHKLNMPVKLRLPFRIQCRFSAPLASSFVQQIQSNCAVTNTEYKESKTKRLQANHLKALDAKNSATWRSWPYRL